MIQAIMKILDLISSTIQLIPSSRPEPVIALQGIILQFLSFVPAKVSSSRASLISLGVSAPATSYLLQKIKRVAPANFSY